MGVNKLTSEAVNVRNYIERCKDVDGYEFLSTLNMPNPYTPTTIPGDVRGRYVRISINNRDNNVLHFAELQVISNNRNIALGKPSSSSSVNFGAQPSRANDGNNDGNFNNGSVFHSNNNGGPQFWEVDLGDSAQTIDRVIVSNRTDAQSGLLTNWLLSIYDYNKNLVWARVFPDPPNPRFVYDISQANNDMVNIKIQDYNQSRFNNYFYRISNTSQFANKRSSDGAGCYEQCHKEICEGERKKWIGNPNWYGCRDYNPGEWEAEQAAAKAAALAAALAAEKELAERPTCNFRDSTKCIFKGYTKQGNGCVSSNENPTYNAPELATYSQEGFNNWLKALWSRDGGNNKAMSERAVVDDFINRCTTEWDCNLSGGGNTAPIRKGPSGDIECMSLNGRDCLWNNSQICNVQKTAFGHIPVLNTPLVCGNMHNRTWGITGYGSPSHWCTKAKNILG